MTDVELITDADLAELLGITVTDVRRFCRERGWPCVRPKRSVWRFTEGQVEQIVAMQSNRPKSQPERPAGLVPGQTARSAAYHRGRSS